jgi:hypothetical protein
LDELAGHIDDICAYTPGPKKNADQLSIAESVNAMSQQFLPRPLVSGHFSDCQLSHLRALLIWRALEENFGAPRPLPD